MTDQEVEQLYDELKKHYGDKLVNFDVFPSIFAHQVKMYRYYKGMSNASSNSDGQRN